MSLASRDARSASVRGLRRAAPVGTRAATDATVRVVATSALWLALLLVTYWWDADGGVRDLCGWVTGLDSLGRLTGLVASVLLLAQVVLMARVPLLEAAYGQDRLAHLHRLVGLHLVQPDARPRRADHLGLRRRAGCRRPPARCGTSSRTTPACCWPRPGRCACSSSWLTSIKAARRRIRYESWHLLHLYAYLGVGLALPHQLWTGQQFLSSPGRTVFWWTAWARGGRVVLVWRVGVPVWRNLRHRLG